MEVIESYIIFRCLTLMLLIIIISIYNKIGWLRAILTLRLVHISAGVVVTAILIV